MDSITRLAFAAAMLGATTLWMAGYPARTDQGDPLNPGATPLRFTQAMRAAGEPSDGASENNAGEDPEDSSTRRPVPLLSPDAIELMSIGQLYWSGNGLHGDAVADPSDFVPGSQSTP
jgi:hypothetical protein